MTKDTTIRLQFQAIFDRLLISWSVALVMDTKYNFKNHEAKLYSFWEKNGLFDAKINPKKKPFSIILPPPNANADLHVGHAMYVYEDIMIRYKKLNGYEVLWLAGADHAGIETQFVYEKHLEKQGKSRMDFDRDTLFKDIWDFVMKNRSIMENQLRKLGFALDWSKKKFTMDDDIVKIVYQTFKDMFDQGLVYRANRLVNYCTSCGTSFSDLEVVDKDVEGEMFYIDFPLKGGGKITIATTRPETYVGDVAVMVNPKDKRYKDLIGESVVLPITGREIPIVADEYVDMKFGSGAVKITPNHDFNDFEIAKRHKLNFPPVIGFDGHMVNTSIPEIEGVYVLKARKILVQMLKDQGYLNKIKKHKMVNRVCYRCGTTLQPLPKPQWYINVDPLKKQAIEILKKDKIKIYPKKFKKRLIQILENFIDWNVSRQIVWGIRIPAYQCQESNLKFQNSKQKTGSRIGVRDDNEIGWFVSVEKPDKCLICGECEFIQDEDTFDTWFSSAQWPFATLQSVSSQVDSRQKKAQEKSLKKPTSYKLQATSFFDYFYPTSVMETGYDILRAWVSRMIMAGYFETKKIPFENVFLHGMVRDKKGQKMSKSKGNVINPLDMIEKFGADALRAALVFGTKEGGDVVLSEDKIVAMRNFGNKIWNIGRYIHINSNLKSPASPTGRQISNSKKTKTSKITKTKTILKLEKEFKTIEKKYHQNFKKFQFAKAFDLMYSFVWHRFADFYIEKLKQEIGNGNIEASLELKRVYLASLKLLHPYMPFVTEAVWQEFNGDKSSILQD